MKSTDRFLSCDWGTSRFRLRLVDRTTLRILAQHGTDDGIQSIAAIHPAGDARRTALGRVLAAGIAAVHADRNPEIPVVISGMASSTLGWHSLPYARLPAEISGRTLVFDDFSQAGRAVRLVSGLQADRDVMRGEETQLVGLFASPVREALAADCLVVLPGTHSKHVRLRAGQIVDFTTHLTGELYAILCDHSTLRPPPESEFDEGAFRAGVAASRETVLSAALFQTRARTVLGQLPAAHSAAFLSGVLIGAEVATLATVGAIPLVLAAGEHLAGRYVTALRELRPDAAVTVIPSAELDAAVIAGQARFLSLTRRKVAFNCA
jgi:2-dehydro-3-deoxygalactonokinase